MYNYWRGCAENGGNKYLASNQAVGGLSPSRRPNFIKDLIAIPYIASTYKMQQFLFF